MAARNKPYEQFGPYILFKKLEQDALGDLWRAGRIDGGQLGPTLALRRLTGGNRAAMAEAVHAVSELLPRLTGTSFARDQVAGIAGDVPFLTWDYAGGRSLRHIIDRARGGKDTQPNPLPIDQAIVIAEKVALSLATIAEMRDTTGSRLSHGALLPQFVWISDDGEIRVAGQQLANGIIESLVDPKVAADAGRYFAPETRMPGTRPKSADVYAMGAILFLLVTGQEPPDAMTASAFVAAVRAAKTMTGAPVPDDIRVILDKSFNLDPSMRYASVTDMKQAISALAHGGKYSATTFNLAFYLSNLLKKEMETEAAEREKESKVNLAPYLEAPKPVAPPAPTPAPAMFIAAEEAAAKPKSKLPLAIAAGVVLALAGAGGWFMFGRTSATPAAVQTASMVPPVTATQPQRVISEPIVVGGGTTSTAPATATTGSADPEAQKKAFEDAVKAKLQAEMMKLQDDYMEELKRQQSRNAPVASAPPPQASSAAAPADEQPPMSAAQLTQQMRETRPAETATAPAPAPVQQANTATSAPAPVIPAPAPVQPSIREGDVVEVGSLDVMPRPVRPISAVYPPVARSQRVSATVVVSALIDENGEVTQVKVLRGYGRLGIDEAAQRAMRQAKFTSPMKAGKRVKTWYPQTIEFRP